MSLHELEQFARGDLALEAGFNIGNIIFELSNERIKRNMSQQELAEKCGLKKFDILRMEKLKAIPRLDTVVRVANCLGFTVKLEKKETESNISRTD